ncbi:MAG TPA: IPT/TIG domain-containing protein [Bryobacteraceae bacterium]|nr:IPT/TIG domain-containing protein [Bryobacteraceae bacterium]
MRNARRNLRILAAAAAIAMLGAPAEAYYHYVYFSGRGGPFSPVNARFDLARLTNDTVVFCVADSGPGSFYPNDSFPSVLAEIQQAVGAWNAVPGSALHLAFGGLEYAGQNANTPGGDVIFQDLGPGLLGLGTPNLPTTPQFISEGGAPFVPITRSTVILTNNTGVQPGPSYLEMFYTTAVHELGHALGMQHTWTASAMSQSVVRNTSRPRPLDADDIAGFLELYGQPGWNANYGSISGQVTFPGGSPAALASVVAIPATGPAVSALTNPDGTYTINGLPPNTYLLYVHPLPPDAILPNGEGLLFPADQAGTPFGASGSFRTVFYPNTLDPNQAAQLAIAAGTNLGQQNFTVQSRSGVPAYDLVTFSYPDTNAHNYTYSPAQSSPQRVTPAFLNVTQGAVLFEVDANAGAAPVPQSMAVLGVGTARSCAVANVFPCFLSFGNPTFLRGYFSLSSAQGTGPRHLVFNFGNDIYVLPDGLVFVQQGPPYISSVNTNGDGTVTIAGGNFGPDSRVFFDGLQAPATSAPAQNSITVTPPPGASGQTSTVTVFNADSQNSMLFYYQPNAAPTFQYPFATAPQITSVTPSSLTAGASGAPYTAMVSISAMNANFVNGQVTVGGGSSDVLVDGVWVSDANHLVANLSVASGASLGLSELSVISGFQVMTAGFQTQAPNAILPLIFGVLSADSYQPTLYRGGYGAVYGADLQAAAAATATLNGAPVPVLFSSPNQVNFSVPANVPTGPAVLSLFNGSGTVNLMVPIGNPPPAIQGVANSQGPVDAAHPANVGDVLSVFVNGIDPTSLPAPSRIQVSVSGLPMAVLQIAAAPNYQVQIQFVLGQSFGGSPVPVSVSLDGSPGNPYTIAAR